MSDKHSRLSSEPSGPATGGSACFSAVETAVSELRSNLTDIFDYHQSETTREKLVAALALVASFMDQQSFSPIVSNRFMELARGLEELNYGIVVDYLQPTRFSRPPDSDATWHYRFLIAAAVEQLVKLGLSERQASVHITRTHPGVEGQSKTSRPDIVRQWYRAFKTGKIKWEAACDLWQNRETFIAKSWADIGLTPEIPTDSALFLIRMGLAFAFHHQLHPICHDKKLEASLESDKVRTQFGRLPAPTGK